MERLAEVANRSRLMVSQRPLAMDFGGKPVPSAGARVGSAGTANIPEFPGLIGPGQPAPTHVSEIPPSDGWQGKQRRALPRQQWSIT